MKYDFYKIVDRKGSDSIKWNHMEESFGRNDILPMWVADMDFKSANEIIDALKERVDHGVFGYTWMQDSFYNALINWVKKRYNWDIKKEWILFTPGVVMGLNLGARELVDKGEKVLIQPPVYPPFYRVMENNKRLVNENPLVDNGERFVMDYEDLEKKIDKDTRLAMLCNPHNPVGRVWTREELKRFGDICIEKDLTIISDEIHGDFVYKGHKHIPLASISKELEDRTITLMAPSKTFNIAGLATAVAIIPNKELRATYEKAIETMEIGSTSVFGAVGFEAAYNHGEEWLDQLLVYLEDNIDYTLDFIKNEIPEIKAYKPDGTYLVWLDFRSLGRSADEISDALINTGKIGLNDGRPYGKGGEGFFRINIGCPRPILEEGLERIKKAVKSL